MSASRSFACCSAQDAASPLTLRLEFHARGASIAWALDCAYDQPDSYRDVDLRSHRAAARSTLFLDLRDR